MRLSFKPRRLYKYLDPEGAQKLFEAPSLWFRLPNAFNDVFDMNPAGSHPMDGFGAMGVLCLCESPTSSPMWGHYGKNGEGVVLEFDTQSEFFTKYPPCKVRYRVKRPTVKDARRFPQNILLAKSKEWAYEREWRCFIELPRRLSAPERFLVGKRAVSVPFPFEALTAIIHGHNCRVDTRKFRQNPQVGHINEWVCRLDSWKYAFNLCEFDDISHIHEYREAAMWGRRQR